jgi:hypothetical protein
MSQVCLLPKIETMLFGLCFGSGRLSMNFQMKPSVSAMGIAQK